MSCWTSARIVLRRSGDALLAVMVVVLVCMVSWLCVVVVLRASVLRGFFFLGDLLSWRCEGVFLGCGAVGDGGQGGEWEGGGWANC